MACMFTSRRRLLSSRFPMSGGQRRFTAESCFKYPVLGRIDSIVGFVDDGFPYQAHFVRRISSPA